MDRSIIAFQHYREAEQKFDYFITGVTCTLFAFLAKDFTPRAIGRPELAELLSRALLLISMYFGFKRIDVSIRVMHLNHEFLDAQEKKGTIVSNFAGQPMLNSLSGDYISPADVPAVAQDQAMRAKAAMSVLKKYQKKSKICYDFRSLFLILGFIAVPVARMVKAIA